MSTDPFSADAATFISDSHRQDFAVRATHPDWTAPIELDAQSITLTWDETSAPRVNASLTCMAPQDLTTLQLLDPRVGVRIQIDAGYIRPGGVRDVYTIADLGLRSRRVMRPSNTIELVCAGDEALVIDASPAVASVATGSSVSAAIIDLIKQALSPAPYVDVRTTSGSYAVTVSPVTDRWNAIGDLAARIDGYVYDAGLRTWVIENRPVSVASTPDLTLSTGVGGTLIESNVELSRDGWYNYVSLRYEWRDAAGTDQSIETTAYVNSGPYVITGPAGKRIFRDQGIKRETPTTQAEANAVSASMLKVMASRSNTYNVKAISAYWLRPGMTVRLQPRAGVTENHLVSRVTFNIPEGSMELVTRQPETFTIATTTPPPPNPEDPSPDPTPDPQPPARQTYVSTWIASDSATYNGSGAKRTDTTDMVQGYQGSNGNQSAIALFTAANSAGGESGKTVTQALTGAAVAKIEVYLYANHWYYNNGGTARIGEYRGTVIPSTFASGNPYVASAGWPKPGGRWVDISHAGFAAHLLDGTARGVTVGPGLGNSQTYYGRFDGAAGDNKPLLRLTYIK